METLLSNAYTVGGWSASTGASRTLPVPRYTFTSPSPGAEWLALGCSSNGGQENYYSYNPAFAGTEELCPLTSGGQSPIEKYLTQISPR